MEKEITPKPTAETHYHVDCDKNIWNALRNNNKEAFALIYLRFFNLLLQKGLQVSGDRELVKDCIHDLFTEIWINKINLNTPLSIKAYLIVSLQRKIIRKLKKFRSQQTEMERLPLEFVTSKEEQLISEQHMHYQQYKVSCALNSLTKRQKEAIQLRFYSNLSYEEIAGTMKISTDSIYNLVSKAIINLQKGLTKKTDSSL
jgi:RNA polymerase sigma factor (sigma-70 family)